jgi:hypothetical protein
MLQANTSLELLQKIESENLYLKLIEQINKDFQLSNLDVSFQKSITPAELKDQFSATLLHLISNRYDDYLNFLYRVDVSEKELLKIKETDIQNIVNEITFLVLKREFQKVWLKQNY